MAAKKREQVTVSGVQSAMQALVSDIFSEANLNPKFRHGLEHDFVKTLVAGEYVGEEHEPEEVFILAGELRKLGVKVHWSING